VQVVFEQRRHAGVLAIRVGAVLTVDDEQKEKNQRDVEQHLADHRLHLVVHVNLVPQWASTAASAPEACQPCVWPLQRPRPTSSHLQ